MQLPERRDCRTCCIVASCRLFFSSPFHTRWLFLLLEGHVASGTPELHKQVCLVVWAHSPCTLAYTLLQLALFIHMLFICFASRLFVSARCFFM